jgi:rubrerythrin
MLRGIPLEQEERRLDMPEFSSVFSVKKSDRKLTQDELIRAVRLNIAAEYEAVQLYTQLAESIDDELAITVLNDIAREELVHAGEFLKLLMHLAPDEMKVYEEGFGEVEEMREELKKK